jgi:hypothetical protein
MAHHLIPGGCHTYAKGDDQYPISRPGSSRAGSAAGCSTPTAANTSSTAWATARSGWAMPIPRWSMPRSALAVYRRALDDGVERYLLGRPSQTVYRAYNLPKKRPERRPFAPAATVRSPASG